MPVFLLRSCEWSYLEWVFHEAPVAEIEQVQTTTPWMLSPYASPP